MAFWAHLCSQETDAISESSYLNNYIENDKAQDILLKLTCKGKAQLTHHSQLSVSRSHPPSLSQNISKSFTMFYPPREGILLSRVFVSHTIKAILYITHSCLVMTIRMWHVRHVTMRGRGKETGERIFGKQVSDNAKQIQHSYLRKFKKYNEGCFRKLISIVIFESIFE